MGAPVAPPPPPARGCAHRALHLATVTTLLALAALTLAGDPPSCPSASCLHAVGGGARHSGGALPMHRVRTDRCWPSIQAYFTSGGYDADVAEAVTDAARVLLSRERPSPSQIVVFDIDETSLSNRQEWLGVDKPQKWHVKSLAAVTAPLAIHDVRTAVDAAALRGDAHALAPSRALYTALLDAGFSVAFVTGRRDDEATRAATVANLAAAGYGRECLHPPTAAAAEAAAAEAATPLPTAANPCYVTLMMRPAGDSSPASVVKPIARGALVGAGFRIVGALGDQFSDLAGGSPADASFKLPNPVYYIL